MTINMMTIMLFITVFLTRKMGKITCRIALLLLCVMMAGQLPAQQHKQKNARSQTAKTDTLQTKVLQDSLRAENDRLMGVNDSLQKVVESLNAQLQAQSVKQQQATQRIQTENDSLKKLVETQYLFIYRGARALLYRPYNSYYDEYINILSMIPDSLIQARTYGMWSEVKNMIMNSQEDSLYLRDEVWKMIKDLPDEVFQFQEKQMVRRVLQKIPDVPQYSPVQHALSTLNAIPMDRISGDKQQNFRSLINELSAYKQYNEEIKTALTTIKAQAVTTLDYEVLESIINKTQYQKQKEVRIYYLDNVIDSARRLIREAKKENRRVSQTELQKLIDGM